MLKALALALFQVAIAHDKGKPVARQGRKAVSLLGVYESWEIVWLPKAIGKGGNSFEFSDYVQVTPRTKAHRPVLSCARVLNFRPVLIHQTIPNQVQLTNLVSKI
jgi:hypothetical protein